MTTKTIPTITGSLKISIPSELSEISLGMLIGLTDDLSDAETISVLSGVPIEQVYNVRDITQLDVFGEHILSLTHKLKYVYSDTIAIPKTVTISGIQCPVINSLSVEPVGAFMECRDIIAGDINAHITQYGEDGWKENFKPDLNNAAMILAHYFYCKVNKGMPYDAFKAEELKAEILKLPITDALPIARSFFLNYPNLLKQKLSFWQACKHLWKRKQALRNLRSSVITTP